MNEFANSRNLLCLATFVLVAVLGATGAAAFNRPKASLLEPPVQNLTPLQLEIEKQRQRLSSLEVEERRDALMRLGALRHPAASRAAASALTDTAPIVRATAAGSLQALPAEESAAALLPLLGDKDEFVRQQIAYALGRSGSRTATGPLIERLTDKQDSVRGAAAVALGLIGDPAGVTALAAVLSPQSALLPTRKGQKNKSKQNAFVLRAAARSLGQIGDRAALPALIAALQNEQSEADVRRAAAFALGAIGDSAALPALRGAMTASDPYLSETAHAAVRKLSHGSGR
jgi:HEAT repeat protein